VPKNVCFCVCECAGTDIYEKDEKSRENDKTSTRFGKVSKPEPGKLVVKVKAHIVMRVLVVSEIARVTRE
jgi:hypothetical protein